MSMQIWSHKAPAPLLYQNPVTEADYMIKLTPTTKDALYGMFYRLLDGWGSGVCKHYFEDELSLDLKQIKQLKRLGLIEYVGEHECHYDRDKRNCPAPVPTDLGRAFMRLIDERSFAQWMTPEAWRREISFGFSWSAIGVEGEAAARRELLRPFGEALLKHQEPKRVTIFGQKGEKAIAGYAMNPRIYDFGPKVWRTIVQSRTGLNVLNYQRAELLFARMGNPWHHATLVNSAWIQTYVDQHKEIDPEAKEFGLRLMKGEAVRMDQLFQRRQSIYGTFYGGYEGSQIFQYIDTYNVDEAAGINIEWFKRLVPVYASWSERPHEVPADANPIYYWTGVGM
jgi:hypothetical protein